MWLEKDFPEALTFIWDLKVELESTRLRNGKVGLEGRMFHSEEIAYGNTWRPQRRGKGWNKTIKLSVNIYWVNIRGHESIYTERSEEHKTLFGLITQKSFTIVCGHPWILKQKPHNFTSIWQFKIINNNFSNCTDVAVIISCLYSYPQTLFSFVNKTWYKMILYVKMTSFIVTVTPAWIALV